MGLWGRGGRAMHMHMHMLCKWHITFWLHANHPNNHSTRSFFPRLRLQVLHDVTAPEGMPAQPVSLVLPS
jgi:hypothetical protein